MTLELVPSGSSIRIFVPGRPPSPNRTRRRHWSADADEIKRVRGDAYRIAVDARNRSGEAFPLEVAELEFVYQLTAARGDLDNLLSGSKPILDGLVDAGILRTDSVAGLGRITITWRRGPTAGVHVTAREWRQEA